ncbi:MAG TPA: VTT domain-containing protein [Modestobacter sp.]|jgi:membrane-associated protein|nr:VTT domain-containing protein [Modestobacter sp.]
MLIDAAPAFLNPQYLLNAFGLIGVLVIVFAETGLLVGFFLPGDSLLFTAGLISAGGLAGITLAPLWVLLVLIPLAAIAGNLVGYWIGHRAGPAVFNRPDSRFFKAEYVEQAHSFFERYGARTILLARFVPILRTFATVMAGASRMNFRVYAIYSVIGGIAWGAGVTALGHWLGQVQVIRDNIELFAILIVVISVLPIVFELLRARRRNRGADPA